MSHDQSDERPHLPLETLAQGEQPAELQRHYLQNLVHELSTPLTPLLGYLKLFNRNSLGDLSPLQQKCLDSMEHAALRLKQVLSDLSYLLQMESGMVSADYDEPVEIVELMTFVVDDAGAVAAENRIELILDLPDEELIVMGDEPILRVAFNHIIDNGLKFNSPGGKLLIRGQQVPNAFRFEVFDSGIGVPPTEVERVFEPFYQCDHSETRRFGGAGLGLSLARWIIELHGGTISLQSPPDTQPEGHFFRGLKVTVVLPTE